jgi:hypothetical protein
MRFVGNADGKATLVWWRTNYGHNKGLWCAVVLKEHNPSLVRRLSRINAHPFLLMWPCQILQWISRIYVLQCKLFKLFGWYHSSYILQWSWRTRVCFPPKTTSLSWASGWLEISGFQLLGNILDTVLFLSCTFYRLPSRTVINIIDERSYSSYGTGTLQNAFAQHQVKLPSRRNLAHALFVSPLWSKSIAFGGRRTSYMAMQVAAPDGPSVYLKLFRERVTFKLFFNHLWPVLLIGLGSILMPTQPSSNSGYDMFGEHRFDRSSQAKRRSIMNVNVDLCSAAPSQCSYSESSLDGPTDWPIGSRSEQNTKW